jgi:hypothetical protein
MYNNTLSTNTSVCYSLFAKDTCDKRKLICCEFPINEIDFLFSPQCLAKTQNVTVNGVFTAWEKYTKKGPVLKVKNMNYTFSTIKGNHLDICAEVTSACSDAAKYTKYAIFKMTEPTCCNHGTVLNV